jgi:hypothetical protein
MRRELAEERRRRPWSPSKEIGKNWFHQHPPPLLHGRPGCSQAGLP